MMNFRVSDRSQSECLLVLYQLFPSPAGEMKVLKDSQLEVCSISNLCDLSCSAKVLLPHAQ